MPDATQADSAPLSVRTTRLHRPLIPERVLPRTRLTDRFENGFSRSLTIASAPAGFGKTLAASQWCATQDRPCAWLSLDASIVTVRSFVAHMVGAIQVACPDSMTNTTEMAAAPQLPDLVALVTELSNDFDELDERIVIVFDDYHSIETPEIHRMIAALLRDPPRLLHIVITTRQDPPLPLTQLRAKGQLTEFRMTELAFSNQEVGEFFHQELGRPPTAAELHALSTSTEGWPVGLRLATEAVRTTPPGSEIRGAGFLDRGTQEYLALEVLHGLPPTVRRHLVAASLLDRFNGELCQAIVADLMPGPTSMTGDEFIDWIIRHNLFVVALDSQGVWFRFHHLFARLLDNWRAARLIELEIPEGHARRTAAHHLENAALIEEAIDQRLVASDREGVARLASTLGAELIESEQWVALERLISLLPADIVTSDPRLVMLTAWISGEVNARFSEMTGQLDRVEELLDGEVVVGPGVETELRGQIDALRGAYVHMIDADFERAIADAQAAQRLLEHHPGRSLVFAHVLEIVALAGAGRATEAHRVANSVAGARKFADAPFDPLIFAMPYVGWLSGNLGEVEHYGAQLLSVGENYDSDETVSAGHYYLGTTAYERNNLQEAEEHLSVTVDNRYKASSVWFVHGSIALGLTQWALGRAGDADATAAAMMQHVLDIRSEFLLPVASGFLAELDLRAGRASAARQWAGTSASDPVRHRFMFYEPNPTLIQALLTAEDTNERAVGLLDHALEFAQHRHHEPMLIRLLGLRAIALSRAGQEEQALEAMESAIIRSHRSGIIRRLADLGPWIIPIVSRVRVRDDVLDHAAAVLAAIDQQASTSDRVTVGISGSKSVVGEPNLTDRELDVLKLLAARHTNKEIASELFIAPATVKKRTVTLYNKLNVHGRHEAVVKARALGYLSD